MKSQIISSVRGELNPIIRGNLIMCSEYGDVIMIVDESEDFAMVLYSDNKNVKIGETFDLENVGNIQTWNGALQLDNR